MKKTFLFVLPHLGVRGLFLLLLMAGCQPKAITPVSSLIGKIWKAQTVKENTILVYTNGATSSVRPGYVRFRLDLTKPDMVLLTDIDGRLTTGTWLVSTDNKRLILNNLSPAPSDTQGIIEYNILQTPDENSLQLQRTADSRKTGNSTNEYGLIPVQ
jgi:hypothetical protein